MEKLVSMHLNRKKERQPFGCLSFRTEQTEELKAIQKNLFVQLEERFGPCPAEHDNDYVFHMTVALGGAPFENYQKSFEELSKRVYDGEFSFSRLGLLYYDDDAIRPGTYFCYKVVEL